MERHLLQEVGGVSRLEQADAQVVLPVGLGQRAGDGDGFRLPGIAVPGDQVAVGAKLLLLRWLEASGEVIPLDLFRQGASWTGGLRSVPVRKYCPSSG